MKRMICKEFGAPSLLCMETVPDLHAGPDEVLVAVHAIGISFHDLLTVEGRSQLKRDLPITPGNELSGTIKEVGARITGFTVGQRVLGARFHAAFAEEVLFKPHEIYPIPGEMDFPTGATLLIASMTSHYALVERGRLSAGENLLVLGAGSGAGLAAIEIGKVLGARVVAAASSDAKLALARERGADVTMRYSPETPDFAAQKRLYDEFRRHSGPQTKTAGIGKISTISEYAGFDVIYDAVGGAYAEPALRALAYQGRYLSIGFSAGVPTPSLAPLLFKDATLMGIQPASHDGNLISPPVIEQLFEWFLAGTLKPQVTEIYPLERAGEALQRLKDRTAKGRIALVTDLELASLVTPRHSTTLSCRD